MYLTSIVLRAIAIGIIATLTMDVLSIIASKARLTAPLPPRLMGRWFALVAKGRPVMSDIEKVPPIDGEMAIAVPVHYSIGVALAFAYLVVSLALGLNIKNPLTALGFSLSTNLLPWLLMFPAMGYGWLGLRVQPKTRLFWSSLVNHTFYGLGLWLGPPS
jgi:hypothetical protein